MSVVRNSSFRSQNRIYEPHGFGRGLEERPADRSVGMYVSALTEDYGDEGRRAVGELLSRADRIRFYDARAQVEFGS